MTFSGSDGDPTPGALQLTAAFTGFDQYVDIVVGAAQPGFDLSGKTLHARVRLVSGSLSAGSVQLIARTEPAAVAAAGPSLDGAGLPPGTWVPNVAHGSATDSLTGTPIAAVSDTVRAAVQTYEALTLTDAPDTLVSPGATVVFAHRLTDTGNVPVDARLDLANLAGDGFDLTSLALWRLL